MTLPQAEHPAAPAPRWTVWAAHAVALVTLPSGIWRLLLAAGFTAGYTEAGYAAAGIPGWGRLYVVCLSIGTELLALLTLALVRPLPRWRGRRVPPRAVTAVAGAGAAALAVAWTPFALWWTLPHPDMTPLGATVAGFLYLPLVAWAPLLAAVTVSYRRRHRG
ncbi:hypothetical protein AB0F11_22100 [Streptomyces sp. NPDC032472]|uniref:hypothetical protein n=1 Tax=Streptomyces sp. NPDC032472 TaxID=3155018 RepID=UPI003402CEF8